MPLPTPERIAADLRTLRTLWVAIALGVVAFTAVFATLVLGGSGGGSLPPDLPFYLAAIASVASILAAFYVQRRLAEQALPAAADYDAAARAVRTHGLVSLAVMEAGAVLAGVMALLSGTLTPLAFVVPFFAFAWLFFPTEGRYLYLLSRTPLAGGRAVR